MGIMDAFGKEDRIEITVSKLYDLVKDADLAELFRNGLKNNYAMERNQPIWHDAKIDPPKEPGMYYGRKDDTNSMWLCDYRDGKWTLRGSTLSTPQEMDIIQWAEYTAFKSED